MLDKVYLRLRKVREALSFASTVPIRQRAYKEQNICNRITSLAYNLRDMERTLIDLRFAERLEKGLVKCELPEVHAKTDNTDQESAS